MSGTIQGAHRQADHAVRFEWGPTGAEAVSDGAAYAVVVDVLSFTTALAVAVERGMTVFPYRWRDDGAADFARARDAVLAVGRLESRLGAAPDPGAETSHPPRHAAKTAADVTGRRDLGVGLAACAEAGADRIRSGGRGGGGGLSRRR